MEIFIIIFIYLSTYVYDVTICLYYVLCFMLVEHSVCHEPISVLINVFMLLA